MPTQNQHSREHGATLVLFTFLFATVLLPIVGLAIDGGSAFVVKARLSSAMDASALAAARSLSVGLDTASQTTAAQQTAAAYFKSNFPPGLMAATTSEPVTTVTETSDRLRVIHMSATATAPLYFLSMFGQRNITISASSQASRRDVNVMLVLDRSGSMGGTVCTTMKSSAQSFVSKFANQRDRLGLVTFLGSAKVDFPSNLVFKDQSPTKGLSGEISKLVCSGSTGTAQALSVARQEFLVDGTNNLKYPGALNVIVLYTDGEPNGFRANFEIKDPATCKPASGAAVLDGIISRNVTTVEGIFSPAPRNINNGDLPLLDASGCKFVTTKNAQGQNVNNRGKVSQDIVAFPFVDYYQNSTRGYKDVGSDGTTPIVTNSYKVLDAVSWNTADNAGRRVRQIGIMIYTIGLGAAVDTNFCKRMSNTSDSTSFDASQPTGRYVYAPDAGQLASAFDSIASQILRLSQ